MSKGLTNQEIADLLEITHNTVKTHVAAIIAALEVTNRTEAAVVMRDRAKEADSAPNRSNGSGNVVSGPVVPVEERLRAVLAGSSGGSAPGRQDVGIPVPVAVLAFSDLSSAGDQAHVADGVVEEIICCLSRVPEICVSARTSSFLFKDKREPIERIGKTLGVWAVVEGSMRREGSQLRVTATLATTCDGFALWSATYDREVSNVFAVQQDMAKSVVDAVRLCVIGRTAPRSLCAACGSVEAVRAH